MKYDRNIEIMIEIKQLKLSAAPVLKLHVGIAYVLKLVSWNLSSVIHVKGGECTQPPRQISCRNL